MGCKCAGKYWKQAIMSHSIYCLKSALPGTLSDPKKRTMPFPSFFNSNELLYSASANIYVADPTDPWLFAHPSGVGCHQKSQTIRFQGAPSDLLANWMSRMPPFWLSPLTFTLEHLPKWPQRGSSLSSLSSESSSGCICSVDIIKGGPVCGFLLQHHRSIETSPLVPLLFIQSLVK